jgi:hypothetical protein
MKGHNMKQNDTSKPSNSTNTPSETAFDTALRQRFQSEVEPDDNGFSERVMAALPVQPSRISIGWVDWVQRAQWIAISLAAWGFAALTSINEGRLLGTTNSIAAYTLIGLLIFWVVPSRWSRI